MSSDLNAARIRTEELQLRNYLTQLRNRHENDLRDLRDDQTEEVNRVVDQMELQKKNLEHAYEVQISKEAENLEERLHQVRHAHEQRIASEKTSQERELQQIKSSHQARVDEYKKNADAQIDKIRRELQHATETLHAQAKKSALKESKA